jgi:hypothetical protein
VAEAKFVLARAGTIRGVVLEAETGLPIQGARIAVWGSDLTAERTEKAQRKGLSKDAKASAAVAPDPKEEDARAVADSIGQEWRGEKVYTSDDGSFLLEGVSAGAQTVFAAHPSYISEFLDGVEVGLGQEVEVTFRIRKGLAISGHVKDGSGSPLKSCLVFVRGAGESNARVRKSAITDDEGAFQVGGLEKGPYRVMVPQNAQGQDALEVDLQKDQTGLEFALPAP